MRRPRLLDLFCGAGGCSVGYARAGFDVAGVDLHVQPRYPFLEVHQGEAVAFLGDHDFLDGFDVVHASPPCQPFLNLGAVNRALGRRYAHRDLVDVTRDLLQTWGGPYVIENVEGAPLIDPVRLCGTGFGLPLRRHRLFESNLPLDGMPCAHDRFTEPRYWTGWYSDGARTLSTVVQVYGNGGGTDQWPAAMGIDWMRPGELAQAVPPVYAEHVGRQILAAIGGDAPAASGEAAGA